MAEDTLKKKRDSTDFQTSCGCTPSFALTILLSLFSCHFYPNPNPRWILK